MMLQDLGFAKDDKEAASKYFKLDIVKIGLIEKRELNEEFFQEVFPGKGIKTLDELKETLKAEVAQYWEGQSLNQLHDQLYHFLLDETKMEFPESFRNAGSKPVAKSPRRRKKPNMNFPVSVTS